MAGEDDPPRKQLKGILFGFGDFTVDPEEEAGAAIEFGPGFDEMFTRAVDAAREFKEMVVTNGPEDLPTLATAIMPHGAFQLPIDQMCDGMQVRPPEALAAALQVVTSALGRPIAVILLLETLYRRFEPDEEVRPPLRAGELSERWNDGDREGLAEALVVTFATSVQYRSEFMPYHYGDGSVVWDEGSTTDLEEWPDGDLTGNVEMAIAVAFRQEGGTDGTG
jgi:hypothetical protein